jgi:hypothetical protein
VRSCRAAPMNDPAPAKELPPLHLDPANKPDDPTQCSSPVSRPARETCAARASFLMASLFVFEPNVRF